jgi:hypothetical protein
MFGVAEDKLAASNTAVTPASNPARARPNRFIRPVRNARQPGGLIGLARRHHVQPGARPFQQQPGQEADPRHPPDEVGDAEQAAAPQAGELPRPAADEGNALA